MAAPSPNRPNPTELRRLYLDERMPAQRIADMAGVEKITALRWLKAAGIERRPARGLANRGVTEPTAEELRDLVHVQHLSYREIAERFGVDFTAVPYWLDRHDIPKPTVWGTRRNGVPMPRPSDDDLRRMLAEGNSLRSIARELGVASGTVGDWARQAGGSVHRGGWRGDARIVCADGHEARSIYEKRVDDWLHAHGIEHEIEPRYPWDARYRADFRARGVFVEVWGVTNKPCYLERKRMKIRRCEEAGLPLIGIDHWQFAQGRKWWKELERLDA